MMKKFNKYKYLKKLKFNKYNRYLYIGIPCLLILLIGIYFTYSKFIVFKEKEVVRTTVGDFASGDAIIGAYIDGEYSNSLPGKNDGYVVEKIVCDNDASVSWDTDSWGIVLTNLTKRTKCNVYFRTNPINKIISQLDVTGKCPAINEDGSVKVTAAETTNALLCSAPDAYGISYYYRGNVTNNYVKFAGFYWRIIRINGDGTIRVIYDGTEAHTNDDYSIDKEFGNPNSDTLSFGITLYGDDNANVGYMYGKTGASSYAETHANLNDSEAKKVADNWYTRNLSEYSSYIADNVFCNDRSISKIILTEDDFGGDDPDNLEIGYNHGYSTSPTYYRWASGPWNTGNYNDNMLLTCPQQNDSFTVSDTNHGNGALTYPIGLITADELVLAGGWGGSSYAEAPYLRVQLPFYTMSAYGSAGPGVVYPFRALVDTFKPASAVSRRECARFVINLKLEALLFGDGTMANPYRPTEN